MIKYKLLIALAFIFLVTGVLAGTSILNLSLDKSKEDVLKATLQTTDENGTKINVDINPIATKPDCDKKECWSWVSQGNLINTEWRTENRGKTLSELEAERKIWVENRLSNYADVIVLRGERK